MKFETYNFDQIDKNIYFLVLNSPKIYYFSKVNLLKFVTMSLLIRSDQFYFEKTNIFMYIQQENQLWYKMKHPMMYHCVG